jgi:hypothetical protein
MKLEKRAVITNNIPRLCRDIIVFILLRVSDLPNHRNGAFTPCPAHALAMDSKGLNEGKAKEERFQTDSETKRGR